MLSVSKYYPAFFSQLSGTTIKLTRTVENGAEIKTGYL
jgi:hypothetical protein